MTDSPTLKRLSDSVRAFESERSWEQFHDPKNLVMALASEVGELIAILRWVPNSESDDFARDPDTTRRLSQEIGDVAILLLSLCERVGIDLEGAIEEKLRANAQIYPAQAVHGSPERPRRE